MQEMWIFQDVRSQTICVMITKKKKSCQYRMCVDWTRFQITTCLSEVTTWLFLLEIGRRLGLPCFIFYFTVNWDLLETWTFVLETYDLTPTSGNTGRLDNTSFIYYYISLYEALASKVWKPFLLFLFCSSSHRVSQSEAVTESIMPSVMKSTTRLYFKPYILYIPLSPFIFSPTRFVNRAFR